MLQSGGCNELGTDVVYILVVMYKNAIPITWQELGNWDSVGNGSTGGETDTQDQSERMHKAKSLGRNPWEGTQIMRLS